MRNKKGSSLAAASLATNLIFLHDLMIEVVRFLPCHEFWHKEAAAARRISSDGAPKQKLSLFFPPVMEMRHFCAKSTLAREPLICFLLPIFTIYTSGCCTDRRRLSFRINYTRRQPGSNKWALQQVMDAGVDLDGSHNSYAANKMMQPDDNILYRPAATNSSLFTNLIVAWWNGHVYSQNEGSLHKYGIAMFLFPDCLLVCESSTNVTCIIDMLLFSFSLSADCLLQVELYIPTSSSSTWF